VLGQATGTSDHKTHHGPDSGDATTIPHIVYSAKPRILCDAPHAPQRLYWRWGSRFLRVYQRCRPPHSFSLRFLRFSKAAMMNIRSNSEERKDPKINEYLQVADRVREAGRCDRQESGKPELKGNGNAPAFLTPSDGGTSASRDLLARPKQDPEFNSHEKSAFSLRNAHIRDESSADQAQATSVTPKEQMKHPRERGEARKNQPRSDGRTNVTLPQRLLTSEAPEEEQAQDGKRPARSKGAGGARRS
jgi:hypothetical protein